MLKDDMPRYELWFSVDGKEFYTNERFYDEDIANGSVKILNERKNTNKVYFIKKSK